VKSALLLAVLLSPGIALAATATGVPRPEMWIGTPEQWTRGLGIALALLTLAVLVAAWRRLRRGESMRAALGTLFFGLAVLPVLVIFFGYTHGLAGMETVRACGGCHVMTGHVKDLQELQSESLAAVHFKNRYIRENHCYTCHSDYGMFGALSAKADGVRHVVHYVAGTYPVPIKIRHPYQNVRCLGCHGESQKFLKSAGHPDEIRPQVLSGAVSCLDCHGPAHTPAEARK
jgi:nitrate/TMAO reductase-like tetraheme cytochrome c subunit